MQRLATLHCVSKKGPTGPVHNFELYRFKVGLFFETQCTYVADRRQTDGHNTIA